MLFAYAPFSGSKFFIDMVVKLLRIHYAFINWPDINQQQQWINRFIIFCSHSQLVGVDPEMGCDGSRTAGEKQCERHIITYQLLKAFKCQRSRVQLNSECKALSANSCQIEIKSDKQHTHKINYVLQWKAFLLLSAQLTLT